MLPANPTPHQLLPPDRRSDNQVGLLIGKPVVGSRSLLLAVVPSPDQDGQPAITLSSGAAGSAAAKGGGKKGGGGGAAAGGGAASVQLEPDWVAEHARQVSRMLPGGLEVLGLYLLAPESAWSSAAGKLCGALATIATDLEAASPSTAAASSSSSAAAATERALLLLHVDSATRKTTARGCAAAPPPAPGALRVVEMKTGAAAGSLVRLTTRFAIDASLSCGGAAAVDGGKAGGGSGGKKGGRGAAAARLQGVAEALVAAEAARIGSALAALDGGVVPAESAVIGDLLGGDASPSDGADAAAATVELFCAPRAVAAAEAAGAPSAAAAAAPAPQAGVGTLRGEVVGLAYVHRRETAGRALADLKADVVKSLKARLDLLVEEALAAAEDQEEAEREQAQRQQAGGGGAAAASGAAAPPPPAPAHPLLAAVSGARAARLALPRRVLLPWAVAGARLGVCDYLSAGEALEDSVARAQELLGLEEESVGVSQVEELEAVAVAVAPAPTVKASKGGAAAPPGAARGTAVGAAAAGDAAACSSTVVAGLAAGAAAALAVAVGYMSMGSSS